MPNMPGFPQNHSPYTTVNTHYNTTSASGANFDEFSAQFNGGIGQLIANLSAIAKQLENSMRAMMKTLENTMPDMNKLPSADPADFSKMFGNLYGMGNNAAFANQLERQGSNPWDSFGQQASQGTTNT